MIPSKIELLVIIVIWNIVIKVNNAIMPLPSRVLNKRPFTEYDAVARAKIIGIPVSTDTRIASVT
ncbi:hypothetical protein D1872_342190 [compost metagenome]